MGIQIKREEEQEQEEGDDYCANERRNKRQKSFDHKEGEINSPCRSPRNTCDLSGEPHHRRDFHPSHPEQHPHLYRNHYLRPLEEEEEVDSIKISELENKRKYQSEFCSTIMSHSVDSLDDRLHPRPLPPAPHHGLGVDHPWPPGHQLPPHGGAPPPPPHSTIPPPPPPPLGGGGLCDSPLSKSGEEVPLCAGCRLRIVDQFFLLAVEQKWHAACLKCVECGVQLDSQMSCFEKNGAILCKEDYLRIYGQRSRQCARCLNEIQSSDLVMKARHCLFHVECFRCTQCDLTLRKGDLFGMFDEVLYCKAHFEQFTTSNNGGGGGGGMTPGASLPQHTPPEMGGDPTSMYLPPPNGFPPPPPGAPGYFGDPWFPPPPPGGDYPGSGMHGGGDFPYDNNNEPMLKKRRGRKKRKVPAENFPAMNGYLDGSGFPGGPGCLDGSQSKTKRARTSFKHHQLRIMKAHFQINQNPDSRELKMLSQKTGLDKKVLQVWFQNARAKWRRTKAQDGNPQGSSGGGVGGSDNPLDMDSSSGQGMSLSSMMHPGAAGGEASPTSSSDCSSSGAMIPCC